MYAITEAFGVKDLLSCLGYRLLIQLVESPGLGRKVTFQVLGIMAFKNINRGEGLGRDVNNWQIEE